MSNQRVMVNAVSAKVGGAKTMVNNFVRHIGEDKTEYIILAGFEFEGKLPRNVQWLNFSLGGIWAVLYTLLLSSLHSKYLGCDKILSFNNINSFFAKKTYTFFHQAKVFNDYDKSLKCRIYRIYYHFKKNDLVFVQTKLVKSQFHKKFNYPVNMIFVVWPGIDDVPSSKTEVLVKEFGVRFYLVPYTDIDSPHKNFEFILRLSKIIPEKDLIIVTANKPAEFDGLNNIKFIGPVNIEKLYKLYRQTLAVVFPSKIETIGLPIFEANSVGAVVFTLDTDYIRDHILNFNFRNKLIIVNDVREITSFVSGELKETHLINNHTTASYKDSCWDVIFKVIK